MTRLVRGLESQKESTRTGSYSTLSSFLKFKTLKPSKLVEIVGKILTTDQQTSKKVLNLLIFCKNLDIYTFNFNFSCYRREDQFILQEYWYLE